VLKINRSKEAGYIAVVAESESVKWKGKINELETNSKNKRIRDIWRHE
jgi:hypothetical protein